MTQKMNRSEGFPDTEPQIRSGLAQIGNLSLRSVAETDSAANLNHEWTRMDVNPDHGIVAALQRAELTSTSGPGR